MTRLSLAVAVAVAAAGITLLLNIVLLTNATPTHDPVGHLSPSSRLVRPATAPRVVRSSSELPDD
ncbi:MAG TPA: hypothetical protein VF094_08965 [Gaiellaceae bacterium]